MMKKTSLIGLSFMMFTAAITMLSWTPAETTKTTTSTVASLTVNASSEDNALLFDNYVSDIYTVAGLGNTSLDMEVFRKAVVGYYNFKKSNLLSTKKQILSIVDFNKSSRTKRLWIIDLETKKLLFNTLVAHGQGSGEDMAVNFSNNPNSHQSSLGFYVTSDIYYGKHGQSLKLNGMDTGFNTKARERAVVVHGAEYVSEDFIRTHGRLGRSHGCPAIPAALTPAIIATIKGSTCLYINGPVSSYTSKYLDNQIAAEFFTSANSATLHAGL